MSSTYRPPLAQQRSEDSNGPMNDHHRPPPLSRGPSHTRGESMAYTDSPIATSGLPYSLERNDPSVSPVSWPDGKRFKIDSVLYDQSPDSKASDTPFFSPGKSRSSSVRVVNHQHPWFPHLFEAPNYGMLLWHLFLCVAAFPLVYILPKVAQGFSLTLVRAIVGAVCGRKCTSLNTVLQV